MGNPIRDRNSLQSFIVDQCCCCLTLASGCLAIGIFQFITFILWIVDGARSRVGAGNANYITAILVLISAICIFIAHRKKSAGVLWVSCYINLFIFLWAIINAIIQFVALLWVSAILVIVQGLLELYFAIVLRSWAFALEEGVTISPA